MTKLDPRRIPLKKLQKAAEGVSENLKAVEKENTRLKSKRNTRNNATKREVKKALKRIVGNTEKALEKASTEKAVKRAGRNFEREVGKMQKELGATDDQMEKAALEIVDDILTNMLLAVNEARRTTEQIRGGRK